LKFGGFFVAPIETLFSHKNPHIVRCFTWGMYFASGLPKSAAQIYCIIKSENSVTQKEIHEKSLIPPRTIKYAIKLLRANDLILESQNWTDMREKHYLISQPRGVGIPVLTESSEDFK